MYLNSGISSDNENLDIPGRSDHPSDDERGGFCVYFKSCLPMQVLRISMLQKLIYSKLCDFICLYMSPSQIMKEFETFVKNLDLILNV